MRRIASPAFLALLLAGCAALPIAQALIGSRVSVKVPSRLPFPEAPVLELDPAASSAAKLGSTLLKVLSGASLEERLGALVKAQAEPLRVKGAEAFKQQLEEAALFGSVVSEGGDVGLSLGVGRYGLAWDPATKSYALVLDLEAKLSEPHLGTVWRAKRSAADLSRDVKKLAAKVDLAKLLAQPSSLEELGQAALRDLAGQLIEELRTKPPSLR